MKILLTCVLFALYGQALQADAEEVVDVEVDKQIIEDVNSGTTGDRYELETDAKKAAEAKMKDEELNAFEQMGTAGKVEVVEKEKSNGNSSEESDDSSNTTDSADEE
ncbi:MAG: hypothetical protein FJZ58_01640 [Chlamydiae bacterium]|nr:hypothetical protein [Chlamydiota bacterium]